MVFSTSPRVFGATAVIPTPLTLDRVSRGHSITSSFTLFRIPLELLSQILPYLTPRDLQSLALVDRDCCQLARTVLFRAIVFNCHNSAHDLLIFLNDEISDLNSTGRPIVPNIGRCVRRVTVASNLACDEDQDDAESLILERITGLAGEETLQAAARSREDYYRKMCRVISDALPNLQILDWDCDEVMSMSMISSIAMSPLKHLRLNKLCLTEEFVVPILDVEKGWKLETLVVNTSSLGHARRIGSAEPFVCSILEQSASTIRNFAWIGYFTTGGIRLHADYPLLRDISLDSVHTGPLGAIDSSTFSSVFGPGTKCRSLAVDSATLLSSQCLNSQGILSLQSFSWINRSKSMDEQVLEFLSRNTHLLCIDTVYGMSSSRMTHLLDLIQPSFRDLTAVHLTWDDNVIPEESLRTIGAIATLEHLWLSAGLQHGNRHDWEIDHDTISSSFRSLLSLKSLAFSRDSYRSETHHLIDPSVQGYYINKALSPTTRYADYLTHSELLSFRGDGLCFDDAVQLRDKMMDLVWERLHETRMLELSTVYAGALPRLTWCFVGQLAIDIGHCEQTRVCDTSVTGPDPLLLLLKAKWGFCEELPV